MGKCQRVTKTRAMEVMASIPTLIGHFYPKYCSQMTRSPFPFQSADASSIWYTPNEPQGPHLRSSVASPITPVTMYDPVLTPHARDPARRGWGHSARRPHPGEGEHTICHPRTGYGPLTRPSIHRGMHLGPFNSCHSFIHLRLLK